MLDREALGRIVREAWIKWADKQPWPKPGWFTRWEHLSEPLREVDRQIGEAVAAAVRQEVAEEIERLKELGEKYLFREAQARGLLQRAEQMTNPYSASHSLEKQIQLNCDLRAFLAEESEG